MIKLGIAFDPSALLRGVDKMGEAAREPIRAAAAAGAGVLFEEMQSRVPVAEKPRKLKSGKYSIPGSLKRALYAFYSKDNSTEGIRAEYHLAWSRKRAPHGHLLEFGTSRAPAQPFLRPTHDAKAAQAVATANELWVKATKERLAKIK